MAFDGVTVAGIIYELNKKIVDGRIVKVQQPEKDELLLTIKAGETYKLFMSANASLPLIYLTEENKPSPAVAPAFCMLLRKHFNSARIISVHQGHKEEQSLERAIDITIEHLDEMGDLAQKHLIIEIMGKYSNIILCDSEYKILDSIKRVSGFMSSVREVLPGREYFLPQTVDKVNPYSVNCEVFTADVLGKAGPISKILYTGITGISPQAAEEILARSGISGDIQGTELSEDMKIHLFKTFERYMDEIKNGEFVPSLIYRNGEMSEFCALKCNMYNDDSDTEVKETDSVSKMLYQYYAARNLRTVVHQKSSDLRRIVNTAIEREAKKLDLQLKQLADTDKREKYKVYGELITAYGYNVPAGAKSMVALNYYTNEDVTIPLDSTIAPIENAKKYFDKYAKLKRTYEALITLTEETRASLEHLKSIALSLELATGEDDLNQIKKELTDSGYIRFHAVKTKAGKNGKTIKQQKIKSEPLHYVSPEGIHFYVGKNNTQNDELTFGFATNADWWFHAKGCPGSHVIMKAVADELPDIAFEDAGALAAFYSSQSSDGKVEIDYVKKKEVKKPANAKPGFVVYYTNYSLIAKTDISRLTLVE